MKKIIALNKSVGVIQRAYRLNKHCNGWVFNLNRYLKNSPNHKLTQFKFLDGINFCNVNEDHIHYQINLNDDQKKQIFLGTDPINLQTKVDFLKVLKWASRQQNLPYKVVRLKQPGFLSVVTSKSIKANHIIGVQFGEFRNTAKECVIPFAHNIDIMDPAVVLSSQKGVFTTSDITKRYTIQDHLLEICSIFYEQIKVAFNKIKQLEELLKKTTNVRLVNLYQAKIDQQKLIIKDAKEEFEKMDKSSKIIQDYEFDFLNGGKLCPVIENGIAIGSGQEMVNSEKPNKTGIVPPDKVNFDILGACILNVKEKKYAILIYFTKEDMPANHPILDGYGSKVYASEHGYQPIKLDHRIENMDDLNPNKS